MLSPIVIIVLIFGLVIFFSFLPRSKGHKKVGVHGYVSKVEFLTPAERHFLRALDSILHGEIRDFAKVRLADVFAPERTPDRSAWQTAFNRLSSKHVDFLLCRAADLTPLLAIELDDSSHQRASRVARDEFFNELFSKSSIPLIRQKVLRDYDSLKLAAAINHALYPTP